MTLVAGARGSACGYPWFSRSSLHVLNSSLTQNNFSVAGPNVNFNLLLRRAWESKTLLEACAEH
jgi:hypothetical protein